MGRRPGRIRRRLTLQRAQRPPPPRPGGVRRAGIAAPAATTPTRSSGDSSPWQTPRTVTHDTTADVDVACQSEHSYTSDKSGYLTRLKRIEGQARGIHRMVEEEKYCIDSLTQVSALNKALESVALGLLNDHLKHCAMDAAARGASVAEAKLEEASDAIARLVRS